MTKRTRIAIGSTCALVVLAASSLWFIGQETNSAGAVRAQGAQSRLYPGTWPPTARGLLWLVAGIAAVAFDVLVVRELAESRRGKDLALAFAIVTGAAFLAMSVASFANASWSVIY